MKRPTPNAQRITRLALSLLIAFFGMAIFIQSCVKDGTTTPNGAQDDVDVTPRVKAFVERARSEGQQRENTPISIDSAEWYIEAAVNYSAAQAWVVCSNYDVDSLEFSITANGDWIASDDAEAAFNTLIAHIGTLITPDENHLAVADVSLIPSDDGVYTVKTLFQIGSGYEKVLNTTYGPNDYWNFGYDLPNCGCGPNQNAAGACANKWIQNRVNMELGVVALPCYWTNVETKGNHPSAQTFVPVTNYPTGIPATPYPVFWCVQQSSCPECFSPSMMSFYTQGAWNFMQWIKPTGKQPISLTLDWDANLCGPTCVTRIHSALNYYGKKQCPR